MNRSYTPPPPPSSPTPGLYVFKPLRIYYIDAFLLIFKSLHNLSFLFMFMFLQENLNLCTTARCLIKQPIHSRWSVALVSTVVNRSTFFLKSLISIQEYCKQILHPKKTLLLLFTDYNLAKSLTWFYMP